MLAISHPAAPVRMIINRTGSQSHPLCGPARERLLQQDNEEIVSGGRERDARGRLKRGAGKLLIERVKAGEVRGPIWGGGGSMADANRYCWSEFAVEGQTQQRPRACWLDVIGGFGGNCRRDVSRRGTWALWFVLRLKRLSGVGSMASCNTAQHTGEDMKYLSGERSWIASALLAEFLAFGRTLAGGFRPRSNLSQASLKISWRKGQVDVWRLLSVVSWLESCASMLDSLQLSRCLSHKCSNLCYLPAAMVM